MSEKPSINDYGPGDFECQDEFEHWRKHAIAELEAEVNDAHEWLDVVLDDRGRTETLRERLSHVSGRAVQRAMLIFLQKAVSGIEGAARCNIDDQMKES